MKPTDNSQARNEANPLEMQPESVEEANLIRTLHVLVASGKITKEDVMSAWRLGFFA
jgi:hypothetical protein